MSPKIECPSCGQEVHRRRIHTHLSENCTAATADRADAHPDQTDLEVFAE